VKAPGVMELDSNEPLILTVWYRCCHDMPSACRNDQRNDMK
jgi:hypothetical protein